MGLIGMAVGLIQETVGIITDDEKLVKKGAKRTLISAGTTLVGDFIGISDTVDIVSTISDVSEST